MDPIWTYFAAQQLDLARGRAERLLTADHHNPDGLAALAILLLADGAADAEVHNIAAASIGATGPARLALGWALGDHPHAEPHLFAALGETPLSLAEPLVYLFNSMSPAQGSRLIIQRLIGEQRHGAPTNEDSHTFTLALPDLNSTLHLAIYLRRIGRNTEAVELLKQADKVRPHHRLSHALQKCLSLLALGDFAQAKSLSWSSLQAENNNLHFFALHLQALIGLGRIDTADALIQAEIDARISRSNQNPAARADLLQRQGKIAGWTAWRRRQEQATPGWIEQQDGRWRSGAVLAPYPTTGRRLVMAMCADGADPRLAAAARSALDQGCDAALIALTAPLPAPAPAWTTDDRIHLVDFPTLAPASQLTPQTWLVQTAAERLSADWVILGAPDLFPRGPNGLAAALAQALDPITGDPYADRLTAPCFWAQPRPNATHWTELEVLADAWARIDDAWTHTDLTPWLTSIPALWVRVEGFSNIDAAGDVWSAAPRWGGLADVATLLVAFDRHGQTDDGSAWRAVAPTLDAWMRTQRRLIPFNGLQAYA